MNLGYETMSDVDTGVSIHIRHCWRMNFNPAKGNITSHEFQSTFAIAGE